MDKKGLMTHLGTQLIRLVALESHQNGNEVILGFLSRKYVRYRLSANAFIVSLGQIMSKMALGFLHIFHIWARAWATLGHVWFVILNGFHTQC